MHILVLGQSNVANHCGRPLSAARGRVWHEGSLVPLADPIPGGSGQKGSVWTRVAPRMGEDFIVSLRAQGGTGSDDWAEGGRCHAALKSSLAALAACPHPVHAVVFHQGERDTLLRTTQADYEQRIRTLFAMVSAAIRVPWIICRASWRMGETSAAVIAAQNALIGSLPGALAGPDTDRFGDDLREDRTHFSDAGLEQFAAALVACLRGLPGGR